MAYKKTTKTVNIFLRVKCMQAGNMLYKTNDDDEMKQLNGEGWLHAFPEAMPNMRGRGVLLGSISSLLHTRKMA